MYPRRTVHVVPLGTLGVILLPQGAHFAPVFLLARHSVELVVERHEEDNRLG